MAIRALEDLLGAAYIFGREPTEQERALLSWTWEATRRTTNSIAIYLQVHGGWSSDAHAALMVSITEGD